MGFNTFSKLLIVVGVVAQIGLGAFFYLLLKHDGLMRRLCSKVLHLLCKLRILKNEEQKQEKLNAYMDKYRGYSEMLSGHRKTLLIVFLFNLIQRAAQIAVTMFTYLATGGDPQNAGQLFAMQGYVVLGSNFVPIPGGMGVSDYLMLDGFRKIMSESAAVNLELLSRSFSFYICIIICGIATLLGYRTVKKRSKKL